MNRSANSAKPLGSRTLRYATLIFGFFVPMLGGTTAIASTGVNKSLDPRNQFQPSQPLSIPHFRIKSDLKLNGKAPGHVELGGRFWRNYAGRIRQGKISSGLHSYDLLKDYAAQHKLDVHTLESVKAFPAFIERWRQHRNGAFHRSIFVVPFSHGILALFPHLTMTHHARTVTEFVAVHGDGFPYAKTLWPKHFIPADITSKVAEALGPASETVYLPSDAHLVRSDTTTVLIGSDQSTAIHAYPNLRTAPPEITEHIVDHRAVHHAKITIDNMPPLKPQRRFAAWLKRHDLSNIPHAITEAVQFRTDGRTWPRKLQALLVKRHMRNPPQPSDGKQPSVDELLDGLPVRTAGQPTKTFVVPGPTMRMGHTVPRAIDPAITERLFGHIQLANDQDGSSIGVLAKPAN